MALFHIKVIVTGGHRLTMEYNATISLLNSPMPGSHITRLTRIPVGFFFCHEFLVN